MGYLLRSTLQKDKFLVMELPQCNLVQDVFLKRLMDFVPFRSKKQQQPPSLILMFLLLLPMTVQLCYKLRQEHRWEPCLLPFSPLSVSLHCYRNFSIIQSTRDKIDPSYIMPSLKNRKYNIQVQYIIL